MIRQDHRRRARYAHCLRVVEAAVVLVAVAVLLALLPFRLALRLAGLGAAAAGGECPPPTADAAAAAVGRAVTAAARRLPWRPLCLEQALAAALMLRRRGVLSGLCLGVAVAGTNGLADGFRAHAWLTVADGTVCGGTAAAGFIPIAAFPPVSGA